jgi:hypothetical protein
MVSSGGPDPLATVERMAGDLAHLTARVRSLETIVALSQPAAQPALAPRTLLLLLAWPLLAQGLLTLARVALGRARR